MTYRGEAHDRTATHERAPRKAYLLTAKLLTHEGVELDFLVRNISGYGIGGEVRDHHEMKTGDPVKILLMENMELGGTLKWAKWRMVGIKLDVEIDAAGIRQLISPTRRSDDSWEVSRLHQVDPPRPNTRKRRRLL